MSNEFPPPADDPDENAVHRSINVAAVIGGAVLGFIASWVLAAVTIITLYSTSGDSTSTWQLALVFSALALVPVISIAMLLLRRTRQWGAGMLLGVAVGSVIGAGVCASTFVTTGM